GPGRQTDFHLRLLPAGDVAGLEGGVPFQTRGSGAWRHDSVQLLPLANVFVLRRGLANDPGNGIVVLYRKGIRDAPETAPSVVPGGTPIPRTTPSGRGPSSSPGTQGPSRIRRPAGNVRNQAGTAA